MFVSPYRMCHALVYNDCMYQMDRNMVFIKAGADVYTKFPSFLLTFIPTVFYSNMNFSAVRWLTSYCDHLLPLSTTTIHAPTDDRSKLYTSTYLSCFLMSLLPMLLPTHHSDKSIDTYDALYQLCGWNVSGTCIG
jgi:hypothetical protein